MGFKDDVLDLVQVYILMLDGGNVSICYPEHKTGEEKRPEPVEGVGLMTFQRVNNVIHSNMATMVGSLEEK